MSEEDVPKGVSIYSSEHEDFARQVFERFRPGGYLMAGSAEDMVRSYFKMDKADWLSLFRHDYTVAHMRRDGKVAGELKGAYRRLAEMLDWRGEEPWLAVEANPAKAAEDAAKVLFNLYVGRLEVKGWRLREGEALHSGVERELDFRLDEVGDAFRREFGRWMALCSVLSEYAGKVRLSDRVAHWFACQLEGLARLNLYGFIEEELRSKYLNYSLQCILKGGESRVEEALWHLFTAARNSEDAKIARKHGSLNCEDQLVWAMMILEGFERRGFRSEEAYLKDVERRFNRKGLVELYRTALGLDDKSFFRRAFKRDFELAEEEKQAAQRQRRASEEFLEEAADIIREMLEKEGVRVKL